LPNLAAVTVVILLLAANAINIRADLGAMAEVFLQYTRYVSVLKWLTLFLLAYVATMFMAKVSWLEALRCFVVPSVRLDKDYLTTVVAVLGTTISPYLFF
jgi:Mn2+/Fe2+ NRAMP family transporter